MVYSKKTLARIGKEVVQKHPDIASGILSNIKSFPPCDLSKIPEYFNLYCLTEGIEPETIKGAVYSHSLTENKKVFVSAMITIYNEQRQLKKTLSETLQQFPSATTRMIGEVQFRYKKDESFSEKVNNVLKYIFPQQLQPTS